RKTIKIAIELVTHKLDPTALQPGHKAMARTTNLHDSYCRRNVHLLHIRCICISQVWRCIFALVCHNDDLLCVKLIAGHLRQCTPNGGRSVGLDKLECLLPVTQGWSLTLCHRSLHFKGSCIKGVHTKIGIDDGTNKRGELLCDIDRLCHRATFI